MPQQNAVNARGLSDRDEYGMRSSGRVDFGLIDTFSFVDLISCLILLRCTYSILILLCFVFSPTCSYQVPQNLPIHPVIVVPFAF